MQLQKTVFISYRRVDLPLALLVFKDLTHHGYDVFIDYEGIAAGDFQQTIVQNILSRAHFIVVLTPDALRRCSESGDWLRREIEAAIGSRRNVVPLFFNGFSFSSPSVAPRLSGELAQLPKYNGVDVPWMYFDAAMARVRDLFLRQPLDTVLHPVSAAAQKAAEIQHAAAVAVVDAGLPADAVDVGGAAAAPGAQAVRRPAPGPRQDAPVERSAASVASKRKTSTASTRAVAVVAGLAAVGAAVVWWPVRHDDDASTTTATTTTPAPAPLPAPAPAPADESSVPPAPADRSARAGSAYQRGEDFYFGRNGVERNESAAVEWYRIASAQDDPDAQFSLGYMYENGLGGLPRSDADALTWYRSAANRSNAAAETSLGAMYATGRGGLPKSDMDAVAWFTKAAAQGNATAQRNLGVMYEQGRGGLPKSDGEAAVWYRKSADQGLPEAQCNLALLYEGGRGGLPASRDDALAWYRKAAEQGNADGRAAVTRLTGAPQ